MAISVRVVDDTEEFRRKLHQATAAWLCAEMRAIHASISSEAANGEESPPPGDAPAPS
jgi:hypothetical protein